MLKMRSRTSSKTLHNPGGASFFPFCTLESPVRRVWLAVAGDEAYTEGIFHALSDAVHLHRKTGGG